MCRTQLLTCVVLGLFALAASAPTSLSARNARQQLEQLLLDVQLLRKQVLEDRSLRQPTVLTFKFFLPRKVTELKHLQCLAEELKPLEEVLRLAQSKHWAAMQELMSNINATALGLTGPEMRLGCDYDDESVTMAEFLTKWTTFCQSLFSTLS